MQIIPQQLLVAEVVPAAPQWVWISFSVFVAVLLFLDLVVFNRKHTVPTLRHTVMQISLFVGASLVVGLWILFGTDLGSAGAGQYFAAYVVEWSLSVDNIFVIALVMTFFAVPREYQHKVLFWGVMGAIIMRLSFIVLGIELIERFSLLIVFLGLVLIWSGIKLMKSDDEDIDVREMRSYKIITKIVPVTKNFEGPHFFSRAEGALKATPLLLTVFMVEVTDLIFAVDSVPAVLAISSNTFIAFSSNVMAILGLRSIFFLFGYIQDKLSRLNEGLAIILTGIGVKMIVGYEFTLGSFEWHGYHPPTWASLTFILSVLALSVVASLVWPKKEAADSSPSEDDCSASVNTDV